MKQMGIDADIKQYTSAVLYAKAGTKGEKFDAVLAGWGWDYPDPFDFVDMLLNGNNIHETQNNNLAYFNVPAVNKKMDEAAKLVGDDATRPTATRRDDHDEVRTVGGIPPPQPEHVLLGADGSEVLRLPADLRARGPRCGVHQVEIERRAGSEQCGRGSRIGSLGRCDLPVGSPFDALESATA